MTRRRKMLLFAASGLVAVVAVCFFCVRETEPIYNGRSLSQRLLPLVFLPDSTHQGTEAVRAIGTNGLPWLVAWSEYRESPVTKWLNDPSLPSVIRPGWLRKIFPPDNYTKNKMALAGFRILKTNAAPALPELERFFKADSDSGRVWLAASSIGNLGDAALSFFLQIIADKPKSLHALAAIHGIGEMNYLGTNAVRAVPVLLHALENTNDAVMSRTAATTIGRLGVMPEKVMPALSNMFASPDSMRRRDAIQGILGLGEHANIPRTFIVDSLRDPDQLVHIFATHLARKFAPEVLTNSDANSFTFH